MAKILKKEIPMEEIETLTLVEFAGVFGLPISQESPEMLKPYL